MKRGIIDTLRRGAENTLANWQLSAIRFAEVLLFGAIAIAGIFIMFVPIVVSIGIRLSEIRTPDDMQSAMMTLLQSWSLFIWFGVGMLVMMGLFVLVHSYVEAGCARLFVDADIAAGPVVAGPRGRYRLFSVDRWLAGAKEGGWRVFWIYNLAWLVATIILLIPLIPILLLTILFRENPALAAGVGCLGLLLFMLFAILVGFTTGMWTNRAIADWAVQRTTARQALATGWRAVKSDLGRHLLVALAIMVVAMAASSAVSSISMFGRFGSSIGSRATFNLAVLPVQFIAMTISWAISAFIGNWYLASYSALSVESKP